MGLLLQPFWGQFAPDSFGNRSRFFVKDMFLVSKWRFSHGSCFRDPKIALELQRRNSHQAIWRFTEESEEHLRKKTKIKIRFSEEVCPYVIIQKGTTMRTMVATTSSIYIYTYANILGEILRDLIWCH